MQEKIDLLSFLVQPAMKTKNLKKKAYVRFFLI